ncbi:PTS sugar transporter subunit IIA [Sporolactobacillus nakayamae]|uniref:PTS system IIA component, Gat family (TC 4.A.5) n=1 Tax=Sporolactobacillus nakayamae TaxID=269670 RepID=A0A1I2UM17_9BACL|nr:PTS sugar transporter subunit IIA [Sporolactobacillus nakayamae]SFG75906.1 PTS system IIA component, Gat family (TC 4.A.5) [Sporolactobacillus nakayamae]
MFFDRDIMLFHQEAEDSTDIISRIAIRLTEAGIVKRDFGKHVLEREATYPTGLKTKALGVAIPHTDSKYVNQSQIAFASLKKPISFKDMTDPDKKVEVSLVFMIAMSKPHDQMTLLSNLMAVFQNENALIKLLQSDDVAEVKQVLKTNNIE